MALQPGDKVEILERGKWVGPFKISKQSRQDFRARNCGWKG